MMGLRLKRFFHGTGLDKVKAGKLVGRALDPKKLVPLAAQAGAAFATDGASLSMPGGNPFTSLTSMFTKPGGGSSYSFVDLSSLSGFPLNDAGRANMFANPYQTYRDALSIKRSVIHKNNPTFKPLRDGMPEKLPGRLGMAASAPALIIAGGRLAARQLAARYGTTVRGLYAAIKQFGPVAAAAALGISGEQMLQLIASKPRRRTRAGISTRDMRVTRRTVRKLVRFTHDIRMLGSSHHSAARRIGGGTRVVNVK